MKRLLIFSAALLLATVSMAQGSAQPVKRVAILEVVDKSQRVSQDVKLYLRQTLVVAINEMEGYKAVTRINMDAIKDEHKFERSGYVSDGEIKDLGRMNSVEYVLVAEVAPHRNVGYVTLAASLYDVVTGDIVKASEPERASDDERSDEMKNACRNVAHTLLKGRQAGSSSATSVSQGKDFTETAFGINMQMVYVEGGTFLMGHTNPEKESGTYLGKPPHDATVSSFYIGRLEVTQAQWKKVMGTDIYQQRKKGSPSWPLFGEGDDYPIYFVSWEEAKEFCRRLSQQTGRNYTLPTSAEWEYAARGGNKAENTKYSGSDDMDKVAWWTGNSGDRTHLCGSKNPNELGIYDMSGNVYEWCEDWRPYRDYDDNRNGDYGPRRVVRGGAFDCGTEQGLPVWDEVDDRQRGHFHHYGFRVVLH